MHRQFTLYFLIPIIILGSCGTNRTKELLVNVASYLQDYPDSALRVLNSIDTTNVNVVVPAVEYYRKHGTADEIIKSYYYLGRINENAGDICIYFLEFISKSWDTDTEVSSSVRPCGAKGPCIV